MLAAEVSAATGTPARSTVRWRLVPRFAPVGRIPPRLRASGSRHSVRIDCDARPVELVGLAEMPQQELVQQYPNSGVLLVAEPPPTSHAAPAAHFVGSIFRESPFLSTNRMLVSAAQSSIRDDRLSDTPAPRRQQSDQ